MQKRIMVSCGIALALVIVTGLSNVNADTNEVFPAGYTTRISCVSIDSLTSIRRTIDIRDADNTGPDPQYYKWRYTDISTQTFGQTKLYFLPNLGTPTHTGSAVVSSDRKYRCNSATEKNGSVGGANNPARIGVAAGINTKDNVGPTLYASQVVKGSYDSTTGTTFYSHIAVQNVGGYESSVTITYTDRYGSFQGTDQFTIPPQATHIFYMANSPAYTGFIGGAKIVGNNNARLAATVSIYADGNVNTKSQFLSYEAQTFGGYFLNVPRFVRNYYYYNSGISIQNLNNGSTSIQVTWTFNGNQYTRNEVLAAGQTWAGFAPSISELNSVDNLPLSNRTGSAQVWVTTGGPIIANVNEEMRGICYGNPVGGCGTFYSNWVGYGSTYVASNTNGSNKIIFPRVPRRLSSRFSGGIQVANATSSAATCNIYYEGNPSATEYGISIAANGGQISRFLPIVANIPDGFNGSVRVECNKPVYGIGNYSGRDDVNYLGDSFVTDLGQPYD